MKKDCFIHACTREKLKKLLLVMKLSSLLMLLFCMNLSAGIHAQEAKFSVAVENGNIREIIRIIKQQSDYTFVYNVEELDHIGSITMNVKDSDVRTILDVCLKNSGYTYSILDKVIVIRKAELQQQKQIKKIRGIVTDKKKAPLPGVTVLIKGTTIGVSTDQNGRFEIVQPKDSNVTLIVSFIGMKTQTIVYKGKELNIVMEEDSQEMEEVVVTGYQVINRRKNTGSSQRLKMDDIMTAGVPNLDQMLEGRISGMTLVSGSGEVGVAPKIRIRGTSTLIGNREPLWVVDGIIVQDPVPISAEELNDPDYINRIGNAIAGLNPQDIERLDVLKDAAATALYGTKAANGVIVITTKKGRVGAPIINYNMTTTFRQRPRYSDRKIELMNSKERIQFSRELNEQHYVFSGHFNYVGYEGLLNDLYNGKINDTQFAEKVAYLETLNTDWFKLLTEDSFSHQHTVSISGGSNKTRYYASIGYSRDNDVLKGNYNERYTSSLNLESTLTEWLNASFQIQGNASRRKYNQSEISPMDYAYNTSRAIPAYDENGKYAYYEKQTGRYYRQYNILNNWKTVTRTNTPGITVTANLRFGINSWLNATPSFHTPTAIRRSKDIGEKKRITWPVKGVRNTVKPHRLIPHYPTGANSVPMKQETTPTRHVYK
ncbi:MAG: SusC/RagA family TonB-linked outer membrane protein [Butyricimonas faecalis]